MAIEIYPSNRLENLANIFIKNFESLDISIFEQHHVITQTTGIEKWLSYYIAKTNTIFSNISFNNINSFFFNYLIKVLHLPIPLNKDFYKWVLFVLFNDDNTTKQLPSYIQEYIKRDNKRFQFADKIADLFDQYNVFRFEMIKDWKNGISNFSNDNIELKKLEEWQKFLYNKTLQYIQDNNDINFEHLDKEKFLELFINELNSNSEIIDKIKEIGSISIFGISNLTPYFFTLIQHLSKWIDIYIYTINPSKEYWFDLKSKKSEIKRLTYEEVDEFFNNQESFHNEFLVKYGKYIQEFFITLFNNEETLNNYHDEDTYFEEHSNLLLSIIQKDMLHLNYNQLDLNNIDVEKLLQDNSILISNCSSKLREVEVLYDNILQILENDSSIFPEDIVVVAPNIENYIDHIKSVFESNEIKIPYSIADINENSFETPLTALIDILKTFRSNFESESILSLLDNRFIRTKFDIEDIELIREVVSQSNVRWGLNKNSIEAGIDDNKYHTWEYGLKRVMLGVAMKLNIEIDDIKSPFYEIIPNDNIEGLATFELFNFYNFIAKIEEFYLSSKKSKTLKEWQEFVLTIFDEFIKLENSDLDYKNNLDNIISLWNHPLFKDIEMPFLTIVSEIESKVNSTQNSKGLINSGITFASMVPFRDIPYKVVAVLGLNSSDFPKQNSLESINLMKYKPKLGDRNSKNSSKYLFLELILSARSKLYLSYIGTNLKNGNTLEPSLAILDLIDYISKILNCDKKIVEQNLLITYPMFAFSSEYNKEFSTYITTYTDKKDLSISNNHTQLKEDENSQANEIDVGDFLNFFKNPIRWQLRNIYNTNFYSNINILEINDNLEIPNLYKKSIKRELIEGKQPKDIIQYHKKHTGIVPIATLGEYYIDELVDDIEKLKENIKDAKEIEFNIDFTLDSYNFKGTISLYQNNKYELFQYYTEKYDKDKHRLLMFVSAIELIILNKMDSNINRVSFLFENGEQKIEIIENSITLQFGTKTPIIFKISDFDKTLIKLVNIFNKKEENFYHFIVETEENEKDTIKVLFNDVNKYYRGIEEKFKYVREEDVIVLNKLHKTNIINLGNLLYE